MRRGVERSAHGSHARDGPGGAGRGARSRDGQNLVAAEMIQGLEVRNGHVGVPSRWPPARGAKAEPLRRAAEKAVGDIKGVLSVSVVLTAHRDRPHRTPPGARPFPPRAAKGPAAAGPARDSRRGRRDRGRQRQGRRRQIDRRGQSRARPRQARTQDRPARRRHLRPLGAAPARHSPRNPRSRDGKTLSRSRHSASRRCRSAISSGRTSR